MKLLMLKNDLNKFLKKEFPQVCNNFEILNVTSGSLSMLMHITKENLTSYRWGTVGN